MTPLISITNMRSRIIMCFFLAVIEPSQISPNEWRPKATFWTVCDYRINMVFRFVFLFGCMLPVVWSVSCWMITLQLQCWFLNDKILCCVSLFYFCGEILRKKNFKNKYISPLWSMLDQEIFILFVDDEYK